MQEKFTMTHKQWNTFSYKGKKSHRKRCYTLTGGYSQEYLLGGVSFSDQTCTRFANPFIPSPSAVNVLNVDIERYSLRGKKTKLICLYTFVFPFEKVPDCDLRPSTLHCERSSFFPRSLAWAIKKGKIVQINKN